MILLKVRRFSKDMMNRFSAIEEHLAIDYLPGRNWVKGNTHTVYQAKISLFAKTKESSRLSNLLDQQSTIGCTLKEPLGTV